jgi:hypothetical protein
MVNKKYFFFVSACGGWCLCGSIHYFRDSKMALRLIILPPLLPPAPPFFPVPERQ